MTEIEKLKKEIEDLKLIIESKNNQVESKNKHIKRLERIISNIKRTIPIVTEGAECPRTDAIKITKLSFPDYKLPSKPRSGVFRLCRLKNICLFFE